MQQLLGETIQRGEQEDDVMDWLEDILEPETQQDNPVSVDKVEFEMLQYINEPCCKMDVLDFWRKNEARFPLLALLAKKYLCIPASSVPSERIFSLAGYLVNKRRACLSAQNVDMLLFLNQNIKQLQQ